MKKRNRARGRRHRSTQQNIFQAFVDRARRGRKAWTFERLEDRFFMSATPLDSSQWQSLSSNTPQGAAAIAQRELDWYNKLSGTSGSAGLSVQSLSLPNDPYFPNQWNELNTGQVVNDFQFNPSLQPIYGVAGNDINVAPVWDAGITGATGGENLLLSPSDPNYHNVPILVAVNDTGVQLNHPDLAANISSQYRLDLLDGDTDPSPSGQTADAAHGTAVAGLIAAVQNNGIGISGAAPGAKIAPVRIIPSAGGAITDQQIANALILNGAPIDVSNNSWGPGRDSSQANPRQVVSAGPLTLQAFQSLATQGRDGKGTVIVFASGNSAGPETSPGFQDFGVWGSAGATGTNDSRYVISVGAVDHDGSINNSDGTQTLYPEGGPTTLVVAPTGSIAINIGSNTGTGSGITTTDLTNGGFNVPPLPNGLELDGDFFPDTNYTSVFNGTSAAAPQVSAVVALMLQANPNLTYRDVEEILVRSARQNDPYDPSWVVNGRPFFRDPVPDVMPFTGLDDAMNAATGHHPIGNPLSTPRVANLYTNGAGYTVSQGRTGLFGTEYAYGNGEVDANLAVQLAKQWTVKNQTLAPELTWTTFIILPAADIRHGVTTNMDSGKFFVPGGLNIASDPGIDAFFNEFFADMPFSGTPPPTNTRGTIPFTFTVPNSNLMDIESVDVKLDITGDPNAMDYLRIALQSPDGTISDLTNYQLDPATITDAFQTTPEAQFGLQTGGFFVDPPGALFDPTTNPTGTTFSWVYSTKRDWGERSDNEPIVDPASGSATGVKPWELHFENYSSSADLHISGMELVFHGHPIGTPGAPVERVMGKVGVDSGYVDTDNTVKGRNDGNFNFDRYITVLDPLNPLSGDMVRLPASPEFVAAFGSQDPTKTPDEAFASNVTVNARKVSFNGTLTGTPTASVLPASGLVGGVSQVSVGDSITITSGVAKGQTRTITAYDAATGTMTLDSALTKVPVAGDTFTVIIKNSAVIANLAPVAQFVTGADGNYYFDLAAGTYQFDVVDALGRTPKPGVGSNPAYKSSWTATIDTTDAFTRTAGGFNSVTKKYEEYNNLNFLLDPGAAPAAQVIESGKVFTDLDGNGVQDPGEPGAAGFTVYVDANKSGQKEAGEQSVITDANGNYSLTITANQKDTIQIGVVPPAGWVPTNPSTGLRANYAGPGDTLVNQDFGLMPPAGSVPVDPGSPGSVLGIVFNDANLNGSRDGGEIGVSGFHVFVDTNNNGTFDAGEPDAVTDSGGAFFIGNVIPGTLSVRVEVNSPYSLTQPASGSRVVTLTSGAAVTNVAFGVQNLATRDFGDLGGPYPTLLADNGPRNTIVPGFLLGNVIDGEVDGQPTADAKGDDAVGGDEDGIKILDALGNPGGTIHPGANTLQVTVQGVGGYLNGWIDWNQDGDWNDAGEKVFSDLHLNPGTYQLTVTAPANVAAGALAARFRWGSAGQTYTGADIIGETEDYRLPNSVILGDYNSDGVVDNSDYTVWKTTYGSTTDLRADGNHNGVVDASDYSLWRDHMSGSGGSGADSVAVVERSPAEIAALQQAFLAKVGANGLTATQLAYMQRLGFSPDIVQVGDSYHIGISLGASGGGSGANGVIATGLASQGGSTSSTADVPASLTGQPLNVAMIQFASTLAPSSDNSNLVLWNSVTATTRASDDLLLVDEALANLGVSTTSDHDDGFTSLSTDSQTDAHEGDQLSDLTLAAVFDNDTDWRNAI